ncbi:MAG: DUF4390 domain-containing protein [Vicinamibacterales bacterium]
MMRARLGAGVLACVVGTSSMLAGGGEIRVTPVVAEHQVAASFAAPAAFTEDAHAVVQSGLLLTFTFVVELRRPSGLWWDRTVSAVTVGSTAKFDNLTGVYQISKLQDGHVTWSDRTADLTEARTWMTTFDRVPLAAEKQLEPNGDYYIHVRMRASPRRTFSLWPWTGDDSAGRADFTNIR